MLFITVIVSFCLIFLLLIRMVDSDKNNKWGNAVLALVFVILAGQIHILHGSILKESSSWLLILGKLQFLLPLPLIVNRYMFYLYQYQKTALSIRVGLVAFVVALIAISLTTRFHGLFYANDGSLGIFAYVAVVYLAIASFGTLFLSVKLGRILNIYHIIPSLGIALIVMYPGNNVIFELWIISFLLTSIIIHIESEKAIRRDVLPFAKEIVFNSMKDLIVILDNKNRILFINSACSAFTGKSIEDVHLKPIKILYDGLQVLLDIKTDSMTLDYQMQDELFNVRIFDLKDNRNVQQGKMFHMHNVTSEREALKALRMSERKYKNVIENITVGIILFDTDYQVLAYNRMFEQWFPEVTDGSLIKLEMLFDEDHREVAVNKKNIEKTLQKRLTCKNIYTKKIKGITHSFLVISTPYTDENGNLIGGIELIEDITERKNAEEKLQRYEFVANASQEFMSLVTSEYQYEAVNDAFCLATGLTREQILGHKMADLWGRDTFELEIRQNVDRCFRGERPISRSKFSFGKLGDRYLEVSYNPYRDIGGNITHVVVITKDITLYKTTELALEKAREDAVIANKAKSDFLAVMSHEIRTPLNAIIGMTDLALTTSLNKEQYEYLDTVKLSAQNLLDIINDILDLSKIEAGKIELEKIDFDIIHTIQMIIRTLKVQAEQKSLELKLHMPEDFTRFIKGDSVRLRQILVNLIGNAIKFTEQGSVEVRVRCTDFYDNTKKLKFEIEDTGIGILPEQLEKIFDNFTQASTSVTRRYGGTGLGLSICKQLVEMMGGALLVESVPGQGSVFSFSIVVEEGSAEAAMAHEKERISTEVNKRSLQVLIVEDNNINATVAVKFLENLGHMPVTVNDGFEALTLLKTNSFDVVLMDIEMPEMDGFECTVRIRNGEAGEMAKKIPIFAMTAHVLEEMRIKSKEAGMNGYIMKPVDFAELNEILKNMPDSHDFVIGSSHIIQEEGVEQVVPVLEMSEALMRVGGQQDILAQLFKLFLHDVPDKIDMFQKALEERDLKTVHRLAHSLKSSSWNVGGLACRNAALDLEKAAKSEDYSSSHRLYTVLEEELLKLSKAMQDTLSQQGALAAQDTE